MVKMTFTFDEETVNALRRTAARLKKPQSVIVREAIQDYSARAARLSDEERRHMLKVFDRMLARPAEALLAAEIYTTINRPRGREIDIAIAACAIAHGAQLWTVNKVDSKDIPGLKLLRFPVE
jgi:predicted nucleic acid-binding protein